MTPKEKAKDLINKFPLYDWDEEKGYWQNMKDTKKCCIAVVDEIIDVINDNCLEYEDDYWNKVKKEIELF